MAAAVSRARAGPPRSGAVGRRPRADTTAVGRSSDARSARPTHAPLFFRTRVCAPHPRAQVDKAHQLSAAVASLDGMFASLYSATESHVSAHASVLDHDESMRLACATHFQRLVRGHLARKLRGKLAYVVPPFLLGRAHARVGRAGRFGRAAAGWAGRDIHARGRDERARRATRRDPRARLMTSDVRAVVLAPPGMNATRRPT